MATGPVFEDGPKTEAGNDLVRARRQRKGVDGMSDMFPVEFKWGCLVVVVVAIIMLVLVHSL